MPHDILRFEKPNEEALDKQVEHAFANVFGDENETLFQTFFDRLIMQIKGLESQGWQGVTSSKEQHFTPDRLITAIVSTKNSVLEMVESGEINASMDKNFILHEIKKVAASKGITGNLGIRNGVAELVSYEAIFKNRIRKEGPPEQARQLEGSEDSNDAAARELFEDYIQFHNTNEKNHNAEILTPDGETNYLISSIEKLAANGWKGATTSLGEVVSPDSINIAIRDLKKAAIDLLADKKIASCDSPIFKDNLDKLASEFRLTSNLSLRKAVVMAVTRESRVWKLNHR